MKTTFTPSHWKKNLRHVFHLEKENVLTLPQLRGVMEQDAWAIRRLLESPDLYRQNFALQLNRLVTKLLQSHSYYQQNRLRKVLEKGT